MPTKAKIGIIACVLLVAGFAGYAAYKKGNFEASFVKEINKNLSAEDRKTFEDRAAEARQKITEAQNDDDRFSWNMQLGFNLLALGALSDAQKAFEEAVRIKPQESAGYSALFQVQSERGNYEGARTSIKTAISKAPSALGVDLWKKYALLEIEKLGASNDTVSALYSEALVKTNYNIDIITTYADWLEKAGNLQASKEYWQKAIEINPTNKKVYQAEVTRIDKLLKQQP